MLPFDLAFWFVPVFFAHEVKFNLELGAALCPKAELMKLCQHP